MGFGIEHDSQVLLKEGFGLQTVGDGLKTDRVGLKTFRVVEKAVGCRVG